MGISYEEYLPRLAEAQRKLELDRLDQVRIKAGVRAQLHELLADPRWDLYTQQIEQHLQKEIAAVSSLSLMLLDGHNLDVYTKTLAEYRYHVGVKNGLEIALALVRDTVKK